VSEDIWRNMFLVADTGTDPRNALASMSQTIRGIDSELAVADESSMEQRLRDSLWRQRFSSSVLGPFSLAALGIAVLGVFGVTSCLVALRSHEIGVRMAVGARPADILRMVLRQSLALVAIGIGLGLPASIGLTRVLQGLLFGIKATDSLTFAAVVAILMISALGACLLPAKRAANADPVVALRME
jgi:putative ABC transport system permease protein